MIVNLSTAFTRLKCEVIYCVWYKPLYVRKVSYKLSYSATSCLQQIQLEAVPNLRLRRFLDYFGRLSIQIHESNIDRSICPHELESKSGLKRT